MAKKLTPESIIKNQICEFLTLKNYSFWIQESQGTFDTIRKVFRKKNSPYQLNGVSDLIVLLNEQEVPYVLFLEIKAKSAMRPSQIEFKALLERNYHYYAVARSVEDVESVLRLIAVNMQLKIKKAARAFGYERFENVT